MKRFLLFAGYDHRDTGLGWGGFRGDFDTAESARDATSELLLQEKYDWFHIVDTDVGVRVEHGYRQGERWIAFTLRDFEGGLENA